MYENIISEYLNITKDNEIINNLNKYYYYYYADSNNAEIIVSNKKVLKYLDIKSAYPSICKLLYGKDHPFVKKIFSFDNKFDRNKFISVTLANDKSYKYTIADLTIWSKIILFGYVCSVFSNLILLEYKKDGCIFTGEYSKISSNNILEFIINNEFKFHEIDIDLYLRFNKNTVTVVDNDIDIKGLYKNPPKFIQKIVDQLIKTIDNSILSECKKIYSDKFLQILLKSNMHQELIYYYGFERETTISYLNKSNNITNKLTEICPIIYLYNIIFPIVRLLKSRF